MKLYKNRTGIIEILEERLRFTITSSSLPVAVVVLEGWWYTMGGRRTHSAQTNVSDPNMLSQPSEDLATASSWAYSPAYTSPNLL